MNGLYDDFDSLYELYDNDEPTLYVDSSFSNTEQMKIHACCILL